MQFTLSFVIAVIGALIYAFAGHPKASTLGLWIFVCGFFWFVYQISSGHLALR